MFYIIERIVCIPSGRLKPPLTPPKEGDSLLFGEDWKVIFSTGG
jgi:hypothetical protein